MHDVMRNWLHGEGAFTCDHMHLPCDHTSIYIGTFTGMLGALNNEENLLILVQKAISGQSL